MGRILRRLPKREPALHNLPELIRVQAVFGEMLAFKGDLITKQIMEFGAHTRPELAFLLNVIDPGDYVFDLGAHIGTFAVPIAKKVGKGGRVLAVEGDEKIFDVLKKNLQTNQVADIVLPKNEIIAPRHLVPEYVQGNTGGTYLKNEYSDTIHHDYSTIDALAENSFSPKVVKIDIEGLEGWAIANSSFIADNRPILYSEVSTSSWSRYGTKVEDVSDDLRELGYRFFHNIGHRNAPNDNYVASEILDLSDGGSFFDFLAIPETNPQISRLIDLGKPKSTE